MPLSGIRVVDLTRIIAGPFCTQLLADLGAEVIKVEPPGRGDPVRGQGAIKDGLSWYYAQFNRNKKSITLDLYTDDGKEILADLIRRADVLVENYRPGVLDKMGFDAARLEALNPALITASVNGYGSSGPYADRPAFDFIAQAMSGFMSVTGGADEPVRAGPPIADLVAGLYVALGITTALIARGGPARRDLARGRGQRVEASLVGGLISMLAYFSANHFATGDLPLRTGNDHPVVWPYGLFHAADGEVAVAPSTPVHVRRFLDELGLAHLLDDPDFADNAARMRNREALRALIDQKIGAYTVEAWILRLNRAGVPCGRVQTLADVFADPQVQSQEMALEVDHPGHGAVRMTGFPIKFSATPARLQRPAPALGEHTDQVLRDLGYDASRIAALRSRGVV
jgi:crotonobetainyl-CoA:carnitine CoA-transferase CaiB-like acyl-CoA transferase